MFQEYFFICNYLLTILVGFVYWDKLKQSLPLKLWLYFLIYSFFTEIAANLFSITYHIRAIEIYNTWWLVNSFFYMLFFLTKVKKKIKRKVIQGFIVLFGLYVVISLLFFKKYSSVYLVDSYIFGQLLVVLSIMMYYTELLKSEEILNIKHSLFFWISIGALIFNIGMLPVFVISELISFQGIFSYIILGLNIILSLCFITGFIISKKEYNS